MKKLTRALAATSVLSLALAFSVLPAFAWGGFDFDNLRIIKIKNYNKAMIHNDVSALSKTGNNVSEGGDGGSVWDDGKGGNGGSGVVSTGVADSAAVADTAANANSTEITGMESCECDDTLLVIKVENANKAMVHNDVYAGAKTGGNYSSGGNGGSVGDDGKGGAGGSATVMTGDAVSWASSMTVVNSNVTTIEP